MRTQEEKEKDRNATNWLTQPLYKILIVVLVIFELLGKEMDEGIKNFFHIVLWIGLAAVVLINCVNLFAFFGDKKKRSEKNDDVSSDQNSSDEVPLQ